MSKASDGNSLTLIGASAGSGKSHRLTQAVIAAVDPTSSDPINVEGLVAVTYTRKGAAELTARIRRKLVEQGAFGLAQKLPLAYIGTVHAVSLRLVKEFAVDAGLSPLVEVVPGSEARLLAQALESGLDRAFRKRIDDLAVRVELRWNPMLKRNDWLTPVQDIMTLARSNRVMPDALPGMAERSAARLLALLGPAETNGDALDAELLEALETAAAALNRIDDGRKNTGDVRTLLTDTLKRARKGPLRWRDWIHLQNAKPAKTAMAAIAPLSSVAARVDGHPRLHAELHELTLALYEAARQGLTAYDEWKKRRRVVDYVDMIDRALTLVEDDGVRAELGPRLELLVVDEFQDTSPVQLAMFVRLHQLAERSAWVGDRKQCIFEYAGADPALMEAVSDWARTSGAAVEQLPKNWRSRPELVEVSSKLFSAAFARHGYSADEVMTTAERVTPKELAGLPPLGVWSLESGNLGEDPEAIAEGVCRLVKDPDATPVVDRTTGVVRSLEPGDIAVLLGTNAEAEALAGALARRGVRAAIARAGLLATPEGTLVTAALRHLADGSDALALAELEALTGFGGLGAEAWLDRTIALTTQRRAARDSGAEPPPRVPSVVAALLEPLRADVDAFAPSEVLDRVLGALDVARLCMSWPDPEQRLSNIDALRALTATYEECSAQQREAATIAGLLRFLAEAAEKVFVRDEEIASDDQHVGAGRHAVTIATYHRSKGLEWPVVVLGSLARGERRDAFEVSPESDRSKFDAEDPLGERWIRYWPWPYGQMTKTRLTEVAAASAEGVAVSLREERERVRLLYVGFTRARDHLILAARAKKNGGHATKWLDELCDAKEKPLLELPPKPDLTERSTILIRDREGRVARVPVRHWSLSATADPAPLPDRGPRGWVALPGAPSAVRPSYWIAPSRAATEWPDLPVASQMHAEATGPRLPLGSSKGVDWDVVGNTLHAFLAADVPELDGPERLTRAIRLLEAAHLRGLLAPDALVQAGDCLRTWVESRWPGAVWHRELPVAAMIATAHGARRVEGTIDLLLETSDGAVLIDHKSYPGASSTWAIKAAQFGPQLAAYAEALRLAGRPVREQWVSFAVGGGVVRVG